MLVEIKDSNPDKYVHVPIAGLKPISTGADWNLATTTTKQELTALPAVSLTPVPVATARSLALPFPYLQRPDFCSATKMQETVHLR